MMAWVILDRLSGDVAAIIVGAEGVDVGTVLRVWHANANATIGATIRRYTVLPMDLTTWAELRGNHDVREP